MTQKLDPRFKYETYEKNIFATREELTGISKLVLDPDKSVFSLIVNGIRIVALLALFWIRKAMLDEEQMIGRQIYERRRSSSNENDIQDDMDGRAPVANALPKASPTEPKHEI